MENYRLDPHLRPARWREYDFAGKQGKPVFDLPAREIAAFVIDSWRTEVFIATVEHLLVWPRNKAILVEGVFLPKSLLKVAPGSRIAVMVADRAFHARYFAHRYQLCRGRREKKDKVGRDEIILVLALYSQPIA